MHLSTTNYKKYTIPLSNSIYLNHEQYRHHTTEALPDTIWGLRESRDDQAFWTPVVALA